MASKEKLKSISVRFKDLKLSLLLEITKAINNNKSTEELLKIFQEFLHEKLGIGKLILFSLNSENKWVATLKYGVEDEYNDLDIINYLLPIKEITTIQPLFKNVSNSFEIVVPVFHKNVPLAFLLLGDIEEDKRVLSPVIKHLPFIQTLASIIFVAIENKILAKKSLKQVEINKELELASEMQALLIPKLLPNNNNIEMAASYHPHQQVGGDYYDFIELNEQEIVFCMGDVSGKGISAALLMSNFQATLQVYSTLYPNFEKLIHALNQKVNSVAKGEKFITFFIAKYNYRLKELLYVNAGQNPPILLKGDDVIYLDKGCAGLGMIEKIPTISIGKVQINENDIILCYTDGVVELENNKGEAFGTDRLSTFLIKNRNAPLQTINELILLELSSFKEDNPFIDDIALFCSRFY